MRLFVHVVCCFSPCSLFAYRLGDGTRDGIFDPALLTGIDGGSDGAADPGIDGGSDGGIE